MTKIWIEAYNADNSQILGNGQGQGAIKALHYQRTNYYKHLVHGDLRGWPKWTRPQFWKVVSEQGLPLELIPNPSHKGV